RAGDLDDAQMRARREPTVDAAAAGLVLDARQGHAVAHLGCGVLQVGVPHDDLDVLAKVPERLRRLDGGNGDGDHVASLARRARALGSPWTPAGGGAPAAPTSARRGKRPAPASRPPPTGPTAPPPPARPAPP